MVGVDLKDGDGERVVSGRERVRTGVGWLGLTRVGARK